MYFRTGELTKDSNKLVLYLQEMWKEDMLVQYNLNCSNPDGSFTVDDSNSFFSPYKILPIAQENKYLGIFFLFYHGIVCCVYSLGHEGYTLIFLFLLKNIDYGYSLEPPQRGGSNEYPQSMF